MKTYRRLLVYAKPYGTFIVPFFVFTLIGVFFGIFQFALIIPLLNFLFDSHTAAELHQYATMPHFQLSGPYFKNLFYYEVYHLKTLNPVYALYFIAGIIVASVLLTNLF